MGRELNGVLSPVLFIPHGAGPLPLLGDPNHQELIDFLKRIAPSLGKPAAIVVISAHWECEQATIMSGRSPALVYDYYGFPEEAYTIDYPAPGAPLLAEKIFELFQQSGVAVKLDDECCFDHGLFVPLKIMFPDATIPCVQLSLIRNLDPLAHINMGKALVELRKENVLIVGSGFSFHNRRAFLSTMPDAEDSQNEAFEDWLIDTCTNKSLSATARERKLVDWESAPFARYCHPRVEHLLPLHVCVGLTGTPAKLVFQGSVAGKKASAFLW